MPASTVLPGGTMNKDQVKGRIKEAKGKVKKVAAKVAGDEFLEAEGKIQRSIGKAQGHAAGPSQ